MAENKHILLGQIGENIVAGYLQNRKYRLVERNYRKKFGEIDIIAEKDGVLHFVEVKSGLIHGNFKKKGSDRHRPEDHMTPHKKQCLSRTIQAYLLDKKVSEDTEWSVDVVIVELETGKKKARIEMLESVLLG